MSLSCRKAERLGAEVSFKNWMNLGSSGGKMAISEQPLNTSWCPQPGLLLPSLQKPQLFPAITVPVDKVR